MQDLSLGHQSTEGADSNAEALSFLRDRGLPLSEVVLAIFDQSDDCIKLLDLTGSLLFMNCNGRQAMEIEDFQSVAGQHWQDLWPVESRELVAASVDRARAGHVSRFEAFCPTAKGRSRWWDVTVTPVRDSRGDVAAMLSSSRDVTDRKVKEEALASVAAEMKHRLQNAYTVAAAISMALAKDQPEHADFARTLAERMVALAEIQAKLVDVGEAALLDIVDDVVRSFGHADAVQIGTVPNVSLNEDLAKALALVLGELTTNSLKYGALSGRGQVHVSATTSGSELELQWRELNNGEAAPLDFSRVGGGSGRQLMERMLASVGGSLHSARSDEGYAAQVRLKLFADAG